MDFIVDRLATGRMVRILSVVDAYTRECLALEADASLGSGHVTRGTTESAAGVLGVSLRQAPRLTAKYKDGGGALIHKGEAGRRAISCGVHYPTDIKASQTIALALFGALSASPLFQMELAAAKTKLRKQMVAIGVRV